MKSLAVIILFTGISVCSYAQYGRGMGGQMPGGGMQRHHGGTGEGGPGARSRQMSFSGNGHFFTAELTDGQKISGSGIVKIKNDNSTLEIKTEDGRELSYIPAQVKTLSYITRAGNETFINYENKYWLYKLNDNVESFYQTIGESDLLFIKEKDKYREAVKEDIIDLVKNNKEAYKYAKKDKLKKALEAYIGTTAPPVYDMPEHSAGGSEKKNKPLFNAQ